MVGWAVCAQLMVWPAADLAAAGIDYANSRHAGLWLRHPVSGGPSFDAFEHEPQDPLHRGAPPSFRGKKPTPYLQRESTGIRGSMMLCAAPLWSLTLLLGQGILIT